MADLVPTVELNEALKRRIYDAVTATDLRGINLAIGEGSVEFVNDIVKYLTLKDDNGGFLMSDTVGRLITLGLLYNDEVVSFGDSRTRTALAFSAAEGLYSVPLQPFSDLTISLDSSQLGPQETETILNTIVYTVRYETGSLGVDGSVEFVTWWFENPDNLFRLIITNLDTGIITYISHTDEQLVNGEGISVPGSGEQKWEGQIPSIFERGPNYEIKAQSLSSNFRLRGATTTQPFVPYAKFDGYAADVQSSVYLPFWQPGDWNAGDWCFMPYEEQDDPASGPIRFRNKIYLCKTTSTQTGTWDTNRNLYWDVLGSNNPYVAKESISTSLISGGTISESTPTSINIAEGNGRIVSIDSEGVPTVTDVIWSDYNDITLPDIANRNSTRIGVSSSGTLVQLPFSLNTVFIRDYINLGYIIHPNTTIQSINNEPLKQEEIYSQFIDHLDVLGVTRKSGLQISPNANLTIQKKSGELESPGAGVGSGNAGQNRVGISGQNPAVFSRILAKTDTIETQSTTAIDCGFYDDGSGTKQALAQANNATIMYVFQSLNNVTSGLYVAYGQTEYASLQDAEQNLLTDVFVIPEEIEQRTNLIGRIIAERDCDDLSDTTQAIFFPGVRFGAGISGVLSGQAGGGGDVIGPPSSTANEIATYEDSSGKVLRANSNITAISGALRRATLNSDLFMSINGSGRIGIGEATLPTGNTSNKVIINRNSGPNGLLINTNTLDNVWFEFATSATSKGALGYNNTDNSLGLYVGSTNINSPVSAKLLDTGEFKVKKTDDAKVSISANNPTIELQGASGAVQGSLDWNNSSSSNVVLKKQGGSEIILTSDSACVNSKTAIGSSAASGEDNILEVIGTTGAFKPPTLTTAQRDLLSVSSGAIINNSDEDRLEEYRGSSWIPVSGESGSKLLMFAQYVNNGTTSSSIGTDYGFLRLDGPLAFLYSKDGLFTPSAQSIVYTGPPVQGILKVIVNIRANAALSAPNSYDFRIFQTNDAAGPWQVTEKILPDDHAIVVLEAFLTMDSRVTALKFKTSSGPNDAPLTCKHITYSFMEV